MSFEAALIGAAIHILFWQALPKWGTWFNRLIAALPSPLRTLYKQWNCPYCAGFWIALALHAGAGLTTLDGLPELPAFWGQFAVPLGWFLDALATAVLLLVIVVAINALRLPAMRAAMLQKEFAASQEG